MKKLSFKRLSKKVASLIMLPIKNGPLKGYMWIVGSGLKFIKGSYELDTVDFFKSVINEGDVCIDIGGHVGYTGLVMSKLTGDNGTVIIFEPRPVNIQYIEKHIKRNEVNNVVLHKLGISDRSGKATFDVTAGTGTGKITKTGELTIDIDTLDSVYNKENIASPNFIKMDIEGEEYKALLGAENILKKYKPILNISTHGKEVHKACLELVRSIGYSDIESITGGFVAYK
jgi:FkbM family methyltransferase